MRPRVNTLSRFYHCSATHFTEYKSWNAISFVGSTALIGEQFQFCEDNGFLHNICKNHFNFSRTFMGFYWMSATGFSPFLASLLIHTVLLKDFFPRIVLYIAYVTNSEFNCHDYRYTYLTLIVVIHVHKFQFHLNSHHDINMKSS